MTPATSVLEVGDDLERWVSAGLISEDQRSAILAHEQALRTLRLAPPGPAAGHRRIPAVAEALGYLGGLLAVIGLALIVGRYWPDMPTAGRLALSGALAGLLVGAGALAREDLDPAFARLRSFLWLAGTAAATLFVGVLTVDGLDAAPETVVLACAATATSFGGLLWRGRQRPLQQLTFLAGLPVTLGAMVAEQAEGGPVGLAVWLAGASVLAFGVRQQIPTPLLAEVVGAVAVLAGSVVVATDWTSFGLLLAMASAFGLLAIVTLPDRAPVRGERLLLGTLGCLALLQGTPSTLGWFSQDAGGLTGIATWSVGGLLLWFGARGRTRLPLPTELLGGAGLIGGAALTWVQWRGAAPILGVATAVALVALGTQPGQVLLSMLGSLGLLINVPWAISWFFPGEGRVPLLIMVSGALIIATALLLARMGGRLRKDLGALTRR